MPLEMFIIVDGNKRIFFENLTTSGKNFADQIVSMLFPVSFPFLTLLHSLLVLMYLFIAPGDEKCTLSKRFVRAIFL